MTKTSTTTKRTLTKPLTTSLVSCTYLMVLITDDADIYMLGEYLSLKSFWCIVNYN